MISGYIFLSAGSRRWPTYLQDKSHAHAAGLLSTALPTTAQHDWIAYSSIGHTHVGAFAVDVTVPQSDNLVVSDHAALSTPLHCSSDLHCCTDALRCTRTSLRAYAHCCTSALRTTDRTIFVTVISILRHILEFSERCFLLLAFMSCCQRGGCPLSCS